MANPVCEVLLTEAELELHGHGLEGSAGAIVEFWGVVRRLEDGREIDGIDYEAHPAMTEHQLRQIAGQAIEKFALQSIVIRHRIGFVAVGKASVLVRVASRNRREAFQATEWAMDALKKKVPIWKRPKFKIGNQPFGEVGLDKRRDLVSRE